MNCPVIRWGWAGGLIVAGVLTAGFAAPLVQPKTLRVEHGRPVVVASQKSVLVLEFAREPIGDALVAHPEAEGIRHCRARYRYKLYDGGTGQLTDGEGTLAEIRQVVPGTGGTQTKDVGSRTGIDAGEFHLWWSEGGAGARSWIYYHVASPVRFIQQPQQVTLDSISTKEMQRYLNSRNVQEFVAASTTVQVVGPAEFSGHLPTETPVAGRVESGELRDGRFVLKLSGLSTNTHYIIESAYEVSSGNWTPVHTFTARKADHEWSEVLGPDVNLIFYRIRQGPY